jgi:hypothetical protein
MTVTDTDIDALSTGDSPPEKVPLSFNQEFLCAFDEGNEVGAFGPKYNIVYGWRVRGHVDPESLQRAMNLVVERHEALRTTVIRGEEKYQLVHPPSPARLEVRDLPGVDPADRDLRAEELLVELEGGSYYVTDLPVFRAVLARFDENDSVLVLIAHHTAVDGWAIHLVIRDLVHFYATLRGHDLPPLPHAAQYREYVEWEQQRYTETAMTRSREYWRENLAGTEVHSLETDWPKSEGREKHTAVERFQIDRDVVAAVLDLAKETRSSAFMVMLAAQYVYLSRASGRTDLTVSTVASGRGTARFQETVGSFFNFLPLRTELAGCGTFREVIKAARTTCLRAYSNQIPFAQVMGDTPAFGRPWFTDGLAVFPFQVFQFPYVMEREVVGDLELSEIRKRTLPQEDGADIPDGALWTLDLNAESCELVGGLQFNSNLYRRETIQEIMATFFQVLRETVLAPDAELTLPE